ncbi:hypothetical protein D3C76_1278500 [compost metagenome]
MLRLEPGKVLQIGEEPGKVYRLVIQLDFTTLHLIHIDNIVENIPQRHRRNMDGLEILFLLAGQLSIEKNTAQANDAVQRCTQLMADRGDKGGLVAAGALQRILIALTLGNIAAKAHQPVALAHAIVIRHFADFEAGFTPVGIIQPLFVSQRDVVTEHLFVGFDNLGRRFLRVDILRFEVNQLFFTFPC